MKEPSTKPSAAGNTTTPSIVLKRAILIGPLRKTNPATRKMIVDGTKTNRPSKNSARKTPSAPSGVTKFVMISRKVCSIK